MSFGDLNRVNTNLQSLQAQFSLNSVNNRLAENQLKLSTGLRINKAEDDAAGFSIASKLSARLEGLEQAQRNVGDAKSMLNVAETGMNSIMDILVDMKAKATQGATDSIGSKERGYLEKQLESLATEINNIADQTSFQGTELLGEKGTTASSTVSLTFQVGDGAEDTKTIDLDSLRADDLFDTTGALSAVSDGTTGAAGFDLGTAGGATQGDFNTFLSEIDTAIDNLAGNFNEIGIQQSSLSIQQENLAQSITSNSAARSRIMDADFAKVQSESVKLQIMQQTATAALTQANSSPQAVLSFLGG